ncbi:thiamine-phosphate diphosphorylase [Jannaschia faecimaris]|uniref:Thiamine-phosphate synthase n=1 Tax=Jannaschia faecimaris TaxID=1244108 RepID=A0A1H3TBZ6_9RHOB|nr:thiamine phosphate synthase [Jannaschia faecimaris]SDZ47823.1 thiamine-phosphate diphosphorylase [Jannaschia faecimaris]
MGLMQGELQLYLVTDPMLCPGPTLVEQVRAAVAGGVTMVQIRDKRVGTAGLVEQTRAVITALVGTGVRVVVNDDLEAAITSGADGAHIGQDDGDPRAARARLGPGKILGLSCESETLVRAARDSGADYLGLGPVFATATKSDHKTPIGLDGLAAMVAASGLPTVAIGGLNASHVDGVRAAGADGLAVVSAICGTPDPRAAAAAFYPEVRP